MSTRSINDKIVLVVIMMSNFKSVLQTRNYGKININLKMVMDSKGMNKNRLSVLTGVKFDTIQKYYNGDVYRIDVDVLAKFCYALNCDVNDIVEYNKK